MTKTTNLSPKRPKSPFLPFIAALVGVFLQVPRHPQRKTITQVVQSIGHYGQAVRVYTAYNLKKSKTKIEKEGRSNIFCVTV